jgi:hypothetical protein
MELRKSLRVGELRLSIDRLRSNYFPSPLELEVLKEKEAELETLMPTGPEPPRCTNDLHSCTREQLVSDVERLQRKAEPVLRILNDPEQPEQRKNALKFENSFIRYENAVDRLTRFDQQTTRQLWEAQQREQQNEAQ